MSSLKKELTSKSKMEFEVLDEFPEENIIQGHKVEGKEIDIYFPNYRVGIEMNGVYWHRDNKNKHKTKVKICERNGIKLLQFTDIDWREKKEIVISMIKHSIGKTENKIGARKSIIRNISNNEYKLFCEENHIKGYAPASIKLGSYSGGILIAVFSLSKSRFNEDVWECIRFCTKRNYLLVGGLSKFLSFVEKNTHINKFVTYCDLHYGNGNSYIKHMEYLGETPPNYYYTDKIQFFSRQKFQKKS
jgi:hypothetical protein